MSAISYLQSSLMAVDDFTIRVTDDPAGGATTSDWVVTEPTTWNSMDELLADWNTQLLADLGYSPMAVDTSSGKVVATTGGNNITIAFSHAGDGDAVRDHMGEAADVTNQASPYTFTTAHVGGWYPSRPIRSLVRSSIGRPRSQGFSMSGRTTTQHSSAGPAGPLEGSGIDQADVGLAVSLTVDCSADFSEMGQLDAFFDDLWPTLSGALSGLGEPFSLYHRDASQSSLSQFVCYVAEDEHACHYRRLHDGLDTLFEVEQSWRAVSIPGA